MEDYIQWLGKLIYKKSNKPFRTGYKVAIPVGVIDHPKRVGKFAFTVSNDPEYYVSCDQCKLSDGVVKQENRDAVTSYIMMHMEDSKAYFHLMETYKVTPMAITKLLIERGYLPTVVKERGYLE